MLKVKVFLGEKELKAKDTEKVIIINPKVHNIVNNALENSQETKSTTTQDNIA